MPCTARNCRLMPPQTVGSPDSVEMRWVRMQRRHARDVSVLRILQVESGSRSRNLPPPIRESRVAAPRILLMRATAAVQTRRPSRVSLIPFTSSALTGGKFTLNSVSRGNSVGRELARTGVSTCLFSTGSRPVAIIPGEQITSEARRVQVLPSRRRPCRNRARLRPYSGRG